MKPLAKKIRTAAVLTTFGILVLSTPAFAHRIDEYLEATTVTVGRTVVEVQLRLTAGISAASRILAAVDRDNDGRFSVAEQQAYATQVRRDLALSIDGRPVDLRIIRLVYPDPAEIRNGLGDIVLTFSSEIAARDSVRVLSLENHHHPAAPAYLVNALMPTDSAVHILGQQRSRDQSSYELRFATGDLTRIAGLAGDAHESRQSLQASDRRSVVRTYFSHGVHHILTGYDHLLFLAALVLGAVTLWDLVKVVTAFTIAHSMTLTLAALGLVHLPGRVVEPLIAASIVFIAVQNIAWPAQSHGRGRLIVAFFFGLFHGLGFAGGLLDIMHQMPVPLVLLAILGFSLGVEAGNQMVLLPLFALVRAARARINEDVPQSLSARVQRIGSAGISLAGVYYLCIALVGAP